jgi:hypothetical protein
LRKTLLLVTASLCFAATAHSQAPGDNPRVLVRFEAELNDVAARLHAELLSLGFDVSRTEVPSDVGDWKLLESAAREIDAVAAFQVMRTANGVGILIFDRVTGKLVLREVMVSGSESAYDEMVALRAVELLRASLMELKVPDPPRGEIEPPNEVIALVPDEPPGDAAPPPEKEPPSGRPATVDRSPPETNARSDAHASLELSPALAWSPGDMGTQVQVLVVPRWYATARVSLGVVILSPTFGTTVRAAEGSADVTTGLAGIEAALSALERHESWNTNIGLGGSLLWMRATGSAVPPLTGSIDDLFTAVAHLRIGFSLWLGAWARIRADVTAGYALTNPVVRFGERRVANWGRPVIMPSIGVELPLF